MQNAEHARLDFRTLALSAALTLGCFCLMGLLAAGGYFAVSYYELKDERAATIAEREALRNELHDLVPEVEMLREQVVVTRERNQKVLGMLGVEEAPAVGGPDSRDTYAEVYRIHERELMKRLRDDLQNISSSIDETRNVQGSLESYLLEREELLKVLPSMNPAPEGWYTSGFGMRRDPFSNEYKMHTGLDLACTYRCEIRATADGLVVGAGHQGGYGRVITIDHGYGVVTKYAHLNRMDVQVGDYVSRGDRIGLMGMSGRSTGLHLHYEVLYQGRHVDPAYFIID